MRCGNGRALGWAYGSYRFERYRSKPRRGGRALLVPPQPRTWHTCASMAAALAMARDLINLPAADLTPERLADDALAMAPQRRERHAIVRATRLREGYPGRSRRRAGRGVGATPGRLQLGRRRQRRR